MGFILPFIPIIAGVASGASAIMGGIAQNQAAQQQAKAYEMSSRSAKIAADQQENERRSDLLSTLSSIRAIRGARELDPGSPTAAAINSSLTDRAERSIGAERLNNLTQANYYSLMGSSARAQGRASLLAGFLQAGQSLTDASGDLYSLGQNRKWWT